MKCGSRYCSTAGIFSYWMLIDWASVLLITLPFCQLWWRSQPERWWVTVALTRDIKLPLTPLLLVPVRGHVAPSGQTAWRIERCHFADCFPGIVFPDESAILVKHYESINGHSWGFVHILRHLLRDAPVCWWEALPLATDIKTKVSLSRIPPIVKSRSNLEVF